MKHNIILIGFMGSGKSSTGVRLSYRMKMAVEDTDKEIERLAGMTVTEIFSEEGEKGFRKKEAAYLQGLLEKKGRRIISTGGGLPMAEKNREILKELGFVVYLRVTPETVYKRLKNDTTRPLLQTEDPPKKIRELMEKRAPIYEETADFIIDVDDRDFVEVTKEIKNAYHNWLRALEVGKDKAKDKVKGGEQDMQILVINGPNLNFLGIRDKDVYGAQDYDYLLHLIAEKGKQQHCKIEVFQSNHEGAIIDRIQDAYSDGTEGIVINPGAYTHYSYAIRDALADVAKLPKVEVHISDISNREDFRKISVTAPVCDKQIYGQGLDGYLQAIDFLLEKRVEK